MRCSNLKPSSNALWFAFSINGQSATGSENGTPSSSESTPFSPSASPKSILKDFSGYPEVIYATKFFNHHPSQVF